MDDKEILNIVYDKLFDNVGMSQFHIDLPLDRITDQWKSSTSIYFTLDNETQFRLTIESQHVG